MRENHVYSFEKLIVWQKAREFVALIYKKSKAFPSSEKFGLTNQLRRAAVSITANIAEGVSRTSAKEQAHYSQLAYSSLMEVLNHLYISYDLEYIKESDLSEFKSQITIISKQLSTLRKSQLKRSLNPKP